MCTVTRWIDGHIIGLVPLARVQAARTLRNKHPHLKMRLSLHTTVHPVGG